MGKVSKTFLQRINQNLRKKLNLIQWQNTKEVLQWFLQLENKNQAKFIQFDVVDFYPSITSELLESALNFGSNHVNIQRTIILDSKNVLLYSEESPWVKNGENSLFDITMGSCDWA